MERRMDRWTDRQTDDSDFIGHCPTNAEHPKTGINGYLYVFSIDYNIIDNSNINIHK